MRTIDLQGGFHPLHALHAGGAAERATPGWLAQAAWYLGGAILAFLIPYVGTSLLDLPDDWYYLPYFALVGAFLWLYVTRTGVDLGEALRRNWRWSLVFGVAAAFLVGNILKREAATPRPDGRYVASETLWRGAAYGVVDALLLSCFPCLVAYALLRRQLTSVRRRLGYVLLALALTMTITATYHLGYQQYRDHGVASPEVGNTVITLHMLATVNPLGSFVAHASMHVTAYVHTYQTDAFLPPKLTVR
jgi:hypothetical protein